MLKKLDAHLFGHRVGRLKSHVDRTIAFTYDESWDEQDISLGLPRQHPEYDVRPFLEGSLSENDIIRVIWEREYRIPGGNVLGMLAAMGKDAPEAIQFTPPGRPLAQNLSDRTVPLSGCQLEDLMRNVSCEEGVWGVSAGQDEDAFGKFFPAGQQRKTALYRAPDGRWCLPQGCFPSMYITKPQISSDFAYSDVNEAVCLSVMCRLGIKASAETIELVGGVWVSVIERYDHAVTSDGGVERSRQEDSCQILYCMPAYKYEQNGRPTTVAIAQTIRKYASAQDVLEFVKQLAFNITVAGTDAYGKDFSIFETVKGCSPAPVYDVTSYLYKVDPERSECLFLSMQIGGGHHFVAIREPWWADSTSDAGPDADTVLGIVSYVDQNAADAVSEALKKFGQFVAGTSIADLVSRASAFRMSCVTARQKSFCAQN